jgi:hypothetical protein
VGQKPGQFRAFREIRAARKRMNYPLPRRLGSCLNFLRPRPFVRAMRPAFALVVLVMAGCAKVSVTPLGSTADGRRQYEVTCNSKATNTGKCHEATADACGGDYETQSVANTGARPVMVNGQVYAADGDRVLLVACRR